MVVTVRERLTVSAGGYEGPEGSVPYSQGVR
jgi:hypothetical protein